MTAKNSTPVTSSLRRQEARRQRGEVSGSLWQRVSRRVHPRLMIIWTSFYIIALLVLLSGRESMPYRLMQNVKQDITARVDFAFTNKLETSNLRQKAKSTVPFIYACDEAPLNAVQGRLTELLDLARSAGDDKAKFDTEAAKRKLTVADAARKELLGFAADEKNTTAWDALVKRLVERLAREPLVDQLGESGARQPEHKSRLRRSGHPTLDVPTNTLQVASRETIEKTAREIVTSIFPEALRPIAAEVIVQSLAVGTDEKKPAPAAVWRFDQGATAEAQRVVEDSVHPVVRNYKKDETLVSASADKKLSTAELDLLKAEHQAYVNAQRTDPLLRLKRHRFQAGIAGLVLLITLGLGSYATIYEGRLFQTVGRTLGLTVLLLIMVSGARLIELAEWPYDLPVEFSTGLVAIAAALMTIAFGQRFSLGGAAALSALVCLASRGEGNLGQFLTLLTASGIYIFRLREIRTRSKVIVVGVLAGLGAALTSICAGLVAGEDAYYVLLHAACACLGTVIAGFIVQGILPQFERAFGIATSMTLLEWCDASRPLLRLLAQNAPGTYSHSMMISQMAEEAAETIGARGLLARVGAMYHDVGKAAKADYFVENQEARANRHDKLSPTMSMLIILNHVKDGIEMARAYGLPRILHQFIAEHHGTTVVRYFHRAAQEDEAAGRANRFCDRDVPESEFRYPGPKPSCKESAILMLCDGCEGAVRALAEPTPGRIEGVVHQVVMDRLTDGQFDHADITLRELTLVERSLVKSLVGIHHSRIKYPDKAPPARPANGEADAKSPPANGEPGNGQNGGNGGAAGEREPAEAPATRAPAPAPEVARQT